MTKFVVLSKTNPHLPHDSVELQSPPPEDALNDDVAQKNAELYIRQLMQADPSAPSASDPQQDRAPARESAVATDSAPQRKGAKALPVLEPQEELDEEQRLRAALSADMDEIPEAPRGGIVSRLRSRHAFTVGLVLTAFFWPIYLGAAFLVLAWVAVLAIHALRHLVAAGYWHRFARRHPRMAEGLRRAVDRAALRLDTVLDYLPDSLADSLALPDMSQPVAKARPAAGGHGGMRTS